MRYRCVIAAAIACSLASGAGAQSVKKLPESLDANSVHGFNVALVLGDLQGAATPDTLPLGAKKALADMRDFLPYKSYRLLDSQWILCCGGVKVMQSTISGLLRGIEENQYAFSIDVIGSSGPKLSLRFALRDVPDLLKKTRASRPAKDQVPVEQQIEQMLRNQDPGKGIVIDSTFAMDVGETVVIGTSRLKGERALIALLTAVKRL